MRIKVPLQIIEIEPGNYHIIVAGLFANGKPGNWVIDSGASKTVFDKNRSEYYSVLESESDEIHTIGIGDQSVKIFLAIVKTVKLGKQTFKKLKVALLDLSHINELYSNATGLEICGLLGSDFLIKYKAVIDYHKKVLILRI